jgi:hypothetical protein
MSLTPGLMAIFVILVFAGIVLLMIRANRKDQAEKTRQAQKLGFEPLEEIPSELLYRVEELYRNKRNPKLEIHNIYYRTELDRSLYIFDLIGIDDEDTTLGSEMFGIISQALALPRFSLISIPSFDHQSGIGALMDKMLDKVMDLAAKFQDLSRIEFPDKPGFDDNYVVFGRDESAVRSLISRVSWDYLSRGKTSLQVNGSGDFLTVDSSFSMSSDDNNQNLEELYQVTTELARRLEK